MDLFIPFLLTVYQVGYLHTASGPARWCLGQDREGENDLVLSGDLRHPKMKVMISMVSVNSSSYFHGFSMVSMGIDQDPKMGWYVSTIF